MSDGRIYDVWRGDSHPWVQWVKPALFDRLDEVHAAEKAQPARASKALARIESIDTSWLPPKSAVIVDLPGRRAVRAALALGRRGLRPVFAVNANCGPPGVEAISTEKIRRLLVAAADLPACFPTGPDVAPAFILDSRRSGGEWQPPPGSFDNRWVLFPSDLPSAKQLRSAGIEQVVVMQAGPVCLPDLAAVLRAYQAARLSLLLRDVVEKTLGPLHVPEMAWLFDVVGRLFRRLSPRRRADGAYGRWVLLPSGPSHG